MGKIKVLVVSVDVSNLSDEQADRLKIAMEEEVEANFSEDQAYILGSDIRLVNEDGEDEQEVDSNIH